MMAAQGSDVLWNHQIFSLTFLVLAASANSDGMLKKVLHCYCMTSGFVDKILWLIVLDFADLHCDERVV